MEGKVEFLTAIQGHWQVDVNSYSLGGQSWAFPQSIPPASTTVPGTEKGLSFPRAWSTDCHQGENDQGPERGSPKREDRNKDSVPRKDHGPQQRQREDAMDRLGSRLRRQQS